MHQTTWKILLNTTTFYVIAGLCTIILHEIGHALVGLLYGAKPILYHNYVSLQEKKILPFAAIMIAMAGPILSLIQGVFCYRWLQQRSTNNPFSLFLNYFSLFGFTTFFGYMMTAPFITEGDIGFVCEVLELAGWIRISIFFLGMIGLVVLAYWYAPLFARFIPNDTIFEAIKQRQHTFYALTIFAWFFASIVIILSMLPSSHAFSLAAIPLGNMVIWLIFALALKQKRAAIQAETEWLVRPYLLALVFAIGLIVLFRLLRTGVVLYGV